MARSFASGGFVARGRSAGFATSGGFWLSCQRGGTAQDRPNHGPAFITVNSKGNLAMAAFCLGVLATLALIFVCWAFSEPMK
jgi:hypothetical protein